MLRSVVITPELIERLYRLIDHITQQSDSEGTWDCTVTELPSNITLGCVYTDTTTIAIIPQTEGYMAGDATIYIAAASPIVVKSLLDEFKIFRKQLDKMVKIVEQSSSKLTEDQRHTLAVSKKLCDKYKPKETT